MSKSDLRIALAATIGSKIYGAFQAQPQAFCLFSEIPDPRFRTEALTAAWQACIDGTPAAARYHWELCAENYKMEPSPDNLNNYAMATVIAAQQGLLPQVVCDGVLQSLGEDPKAWQESCKEDAVGGHLTSSTPLATASMEQIRKDIVRLGPYIPQVGMETP